MTFAGIHHVLDAAAEPPKPLDDLIGFLFRNARVVLTLEDEHRAANALDVRDRRAFNELLAVSLDVADPAREEAPPVRLRVLDHGDQVRDAEDVHRAAPQLGDTRDAGERREPTVRAAVDGEPLLVEVRLLGHPVRDRAEIA